MLCQGKSSHFINIPWILFPLLRHIYCRNKSWGWRMKVGNLPPALEVTYTVHSTPGQSTVFHTRCNLQARNRLTKIVFRQTNVSPGKKTSYLIKKVTQRCPWQRSALQRTFPDDIQLRLNAVPDNLESGNKCGEYRHNLQLWEVPSQIWRIRTSLQNHSEKEGHLEMHYPNS